MTKPPVPLPGVAAGDIPETRRYRLKNMLLGPPLVTEQLASEPTRSGTRAGVTGEALRNAQTDVSTWLTYGKNYAGWRFADLAQVQPGECCEACSSMDLPDWSCGQVRNYAAVFRQLLYVTAAANHAYAIDALTGRRIWHYQKPVPPELNLCCGQVNRGFAALGDKLFKVNLDSKLVALDAKTGSVIWETTIDDFKKGYSETVAPLVVKNLVLVGVAGAEFGMRGFIDAYDADTGKRVWRFWTVAAQGRAGRRHLGRATPGSAAAAPPGSPAPTIRSSTWSTGARAIRGRI